MITRYNAESPLQSTAGEKLTGTDDKDWQLTYQSLTQLNDGLGSRQVVLYVVGGDRRRGGRVLGSVTNATASGRVDGVSSLMVGPAVPGMPQDREMPADTSWT
jgi:hypothetical protein